MSISLPMTGMVIAEGEPEPMSRVAPAGLPDGDFFVVGVVTPELASTWLRDNRDGPPVIVRCGDDIVAGQVQLEFIVASDKAADMFSVDAGRDTQMFDAATAAAARLAGHEWVQGATPAVVLDRSGAVVAGGASLADVSRPQEFVIFVTHT